MHSALTTETPDDFFLMQVLSDYPCAVVRYHTVRCGAVVYKVTNMSRGRFSIGDKGQSFLLSQTHVMYRTLLNLSSRFPFWYGIIHVLFYETCCGFPLLDKDYGIIGFSTTVPYSTVLYCTVP